MSNTRTFHAHNELEVGRWWCGDNAISQARYREIYFEIYNTGKFSKKRVPRLRLYSVYHDLMCAIYYGMAQFGIRQRYIIRLSQIRKINIVASETSCPTLEKSSFTLYPKFLVIFLDFDYAIHLVRNIDFDFDLNLEL